VELSRDRRSNETLTTTPDNVQWAGTVPAVCRVCAVDAANVHRERSEDGHRARLVLNSDGRRSWSNSATKQSRRDGRLKRFVSRTNANSEHLVGLRAPSRHARHGTSSNGMTTDRNSISDELCPARRTYALRTPRRETQPTIASTNTKFTRVLHKADSQTQLPSFSAIDRDYRPSASTSFDWSIWQHYVSCYNVRR